MAMTLLVADDKGLIVELLHRPDGDYERDMHERHEDAVETGRFVVVDSDGIVDAAGLPYGPEEAEIVERVLQRRADHENIAGVLTRRAEVLREADARLDEDIPPEEWTAAMARITLFTRYSRPVDA